MQEGPVNAAPAKALSKGSHLSTTTAPLDVDFMYSIDQVRALLGNGFPYKGLMDPMALPFQNGVLDEY